MSENRLPDYLEHMRQAASDACDFIKEAGQNNIYIRSHLGHHCGVAFLGKGAAITCETRLALMAQPRPRC